MEGVLIALITAATSIAVALIQATFALRVATLKEQPGQPAPVPPAPVSQATTLSPNRLWLVVSGILIVSNLVWQVYRPDESGYIIHLAAIPWSTCLLAYLRPIRWSYVAGVVTVLSVIPVMVTYLEGRDYYYADALGTLALVFSANAILAAGLAYIRQRKPTGT